MSVPPNMLVTTKMKKFFQKTNKIGTKTENMLHILHVSFQVVDIHMVIYEGWLLRILSFIHNLLSYSVIYMKDNMKLNAYPSYVTVVKMNDLHGK
jgi:hypothetical protein